jgi:hypothetical protein
MELIAKTPGGDSKESSQNFFFFFFSSNFPENIFPQQFIYRIERA